MTTKVWVSGQPAIVGADNSQPGQDRPIIMPPALCPTLGRGFTGGGLKWTTAARGGKRGRRRCGSTNPARLRFRHRRGQTAVGVASRESRRALLLRETMKKRPLLLDLFCGAGGCAAGYHQAGFDVVGVDNRPQPRYLLSGAKQFIQADALEYIAEHGAEYDAIHASPPCQRYSRTGNIGNARQEHPDLVGVVRDLLIATGRPYMIENVPGAPLQFPALVCGLALGLGVKRHRLFESSIFLFGTICPTGHRGDFMSVFGHGSTQRIGGKGWVTVYGGGAPAVADRRRRADAELAKKAMGIDWMTRDELSQAIPPAYTCWIGRQLLRVLET